MHRVTISVDEDHLQTLQTVAREHGTTVSAVVRAAAEALTNNGRAASTIRSRIGPERRGGARAGAGRPKGSCGG